MAAKPVDRIRSMITDLERGARTLGDDIRKRAGTTKVSTDIESALRQLMQGLTNIAAQLEKAAGELRRFLEAGAGGKKGGKARARKSGGTRAAARPVRKAAKKAASAKSATKASSKKSTAKKATAKK